ncbi:MAG: diaminopimelate epimerase [Actinomycetota bacterium]|nr:diaminopimelate epimerase [Actinomycetota bacterium]
MRVYKGHGTENDFVVIPDLDGALELSPAVVRALCDRHAGIGADGVLRVVRSDNDPDAKEMALEAPYFMDYRNADGTIAEMCGNGARVFLRYLQAASLVGLSATVATRSGVKRVETAEDGTVTVEMGRPEPSAGQPSVTGRDGVSRPGRSISMPNPHVVVWLDNAGALQDLDLTVAPVVAPTGPHGQNVEFGIRLGPRHLAMRVFERGVGETRSCGTGICAVAVAAAEADQVGADGGAWRVDVPGGTCEVIWRTDGQLQLRGPAVLVASIDLDDAWLAALMRRGD